MQPILANLIFDAYRTSSFINQVIVLLLVALSIYTLWLIVGKLSDIKIIDRLNTKFSRQYRGRAHPSQLFVEAQGKFAPGIPMASIYSEVMKEFMSIMRKRGIQETDFVSWQPGAMGTAISETEMASLRAVAEGNLSEQILFIESKMSVLATCVTTAPSLGLFGTVYGVMDSFMAMAQSGSALMVKAVAPGISGALLTTVAGLAIAIPAGLFYNHIGDKVRSTTVKVENFTDELVSDIARLHVIPTEGKV